MHPLDTTEKHTANFWTFTPGEKKKEVYAQSNLTFEATTM